MDTNPYYDLYLARNTFDLSELLKPIVQHPTPKDQSRIKSASLGEVRRHLSANGDVLMGKQDSQFCSKSKDKIQLYCEDDFKLEDILIPEEDFYSVYIEKNLTKPNFVEISRRLNLNKGRRKESSDGSIVAASKSAFSIKSPHLMNVTVNNNLKRIHEKTNEDFKKFWERSFDHQVIVPSLQSSVDLKNYDIIYYEKGSIRLSSKDLEVTDEYIRAITDALDEGQNDACKREALNKVGKEYGFFWAQEIKLGGKSQNASSTSINNYDAIGGDITKCNNEDEWLESLSSYENWVIIEYDDKLSLYELLTEELKSRIKKAFGMKILHSDILNIKMSESIYPVPKPPNIVTFKNHKIFVSMINNTSDANNKNLSNNVFAIRVDYQNPESPYFIIHRLGMVIKNSPPINISAPWIIIGYDDKFPIEQFSKTSCIEHIEHIWTKDSTDTEIKLPKPIYQDYCWISTCVLDCEENPGYEFGMSNIVISHHFCQSDNKKVKICCNQHNLSDHSILTPLIFKINCAIVLGTSDTKKSHPFIVSMNNHNWKESKENWYFTDLLLKQHNNNSIFTGNNWNLPDNENYIFASLLYSSSSEFFGPCCSLLLNINRKCPIVKSFN
ncbi:43555_t:CDS:2, partial [Gigaspora margarita]